MIIDTHAHYNDDSYDDDREIILEDLKKYNEYIVNIGTDIKSSEHSIGLSEKYDFIYATVGIHPSDIKNFKLDDIKKIEELSFHKKVVAIGEIGLDYYWDKDNKEQQLNFFIEQINVARRRNLPIVVHSRDAAKDTFDIIKNSGYSNGIIHCFSYSSELALEYEKLGYYIGVGGVVTFKNSKEIKKVVENISIDKIVLETDSPYLSPEPKRGRRNDSSNLIYVAKKIGEIKGIDYKEVINICNENARRVYGI